MYAAEVAAHLQRMYPTRVVVGTYTHQADTNIDAARANVSSNNPIDWGNTGISFCHVVVESDIDGKTYHIDTTGVSPKKATTTMGDFVILDGFLTIKEASELASYQSGWNRVFDRSAIPSINLMIDKTFTKIRKAIEKEAAKIVKEKEILESFYCR